MYFPGIQFRIPRTNGVVAGGNDDEDRTTKKSRMGAPGLYDRGCIFGMDKALHNTLSKPKLLAEGSYLVDNYKSHTAAMRVTSGFPQYQSRGVCRQTPHRLHSLWMHWTLESLPILSGVTAIMLQDAPI